MQSVKSEYKAAKKVLRWSSSTCFEEYCIPINLFCSSEPRPKLKKQATKANELKKAYMPKYSLVRHRDTIPMPTIFKIIPAILEIATIEDCFKMVFDKLEDLLRN